MEKFSCLDIYNDDYFYDFISSRNITRSTKKAHVYGLKDYCNFIKKTPTQLILEAENEQDNNIKLRDRKIKKYLLTFISDLKIKNKSYNTVRNKLSSVKAFYHEYDIITPPKLPISPNKDEIIYRGIEDLPTLEEINKIISIANPRDAALVLLQLSSGMGASEVRNLTIADFFKALKLPQSKIFDLDHIKENLLSREENDLIGMWRIHRFKIANPYITFNSPESTKAILNYLEQRVVNNKTINSVQDYLFVNTTNKQLQKTAYTLIYQRLNDNAGFTRRGNDRRYITSHQLREIFSTNLLRCRIDKLTIDYLLGHKINGQDMAYFRADPETLKLDYIKALPHITLEKVKIKTVTSPEFDKLLHDSKLKDKKIAEMEKKQEKLEAMVTELLKNQS